MQYIIDIGAHVGWYTDQWANNDANIIFAFEPSPINLNTLRHKYVEHGNVIILPYAVGTTNGKVKLYRAEDSHGGPQDTGRSSVRLENNNVSDDRFFEVQMVRLSDFIDMMGIEQFRALKIDTEGNEHVILEDLLDNGLINKFDEILFENHCDLFDDAYSLREKAIHYRLKQEFRGLLNLDKRWTH
jgi:FkbM family methyltransferase